MGAYFGKTRNEISMQLEDNEFENWKIWAGKQNTEAQLRLSQESAQDSYDEESPLDASAANMEGIEEARADAEAAKKQAVPAS